jgi:hypothetical protein
MADVRVELASDADIGAFLAKATGTFFDDRLGPDITADAVRGCPVLTGRLSASLDHEVLTDAPRLPTLVVGSFPDEEGPVDYAAATELGFDGEEIVRAHTRNGRPVAEHTRQGHTPEQPYLRPALYRKRSA